MSGKYTEDQKKELVKKYRELRGTGMTAIAACKELNITYATMWEWNRRSDDYNQTTISRAPHTKRVDFSTGTPRPINEIPEPEEQVVVTLLQGTSTSVARTLSKIFEGKSA